MTKARNIADLLSTANGKIAGSNLDVSFENITDIGDEGTKVASGTTAERGSTTGQIRFNSTTGLAEYYTGTGFKIIDAPPTVISINVTEVDSQAGGNQTIVITGSGFNSGATVTYVGNAGTDFNASSVTVNSETQITAVAPKSSFLNAQEPYGVKVLNVSGLSGILASQINIDTSPSFGVASGSLGTLNDTNRASSNLTTITATDADGDTITFSKLSGTLPTGISLNSNGTLSGTANAETSDTTYNFTIRATANSKNVDRAYSILVQAPVITGYNSVDTSVSGYAIYAFTTSGSSISTTFTSTTSADVLIVAGGGAGGYVYGNNDMGKGGGGAGQVLYKTGHSISAGSYTFVIGNGGAGRLNGNNQVPPQTPDGQNTTAFGLTANGGGNGGSGDGYHTAGRGGSAGGSGARDGNAGTSYTSNKTTPSGWNSYGNNGGTSINSNASGGGGGGAGANGGNQSGGSNDANSLGGAGGAGIDLSSTFGTNFGESGYFAGGGGGGTYRGSQNSTITMARASGGQGGGGDGVASTDRNGGSSYQFLSDNRDGLANTGGGGGGGAEDHDVVSGQGSSSGAGGSGVILIRVAV